MLASKATADSAHKVAAKLPATQEDIYNIPSSRETSPCSTDSELPQITAQSSNKAAKKRKHSSAFSTAAPATLRQIARFRDKSSIRQNAAPKILNRGTSAHAPKRIFTPRSNIDVAQASSTGPLPPISLRASEAATKLNYIDNTSYNSTQSPRRRLIDVLAAQEADSVDSDMGSESSMEPSNKQRAHMMLDIADKGQTTPSRESRVGAARIQDRRPAPPKDGKIVLTYSKSRSFLCAPTTQDNGVIFQDENIEHLGSETVDHFATPISSSADYELSEEGDGPRVGIQSVHELRRAGAINRFSDEINDLLSRIGDPTPAPSILRCNALCELAVKLQRKDFASQFRDHAARDNIVRKIGTETDVITGFALVAILVIFLSFRPAPHLLRHVISEGVGKLLCLLFREQEDVEVVLSRENAKLSRTTKASLLNTKLSILQMEIWRERKLLVLTPRTLALQLLSILSRHADVQCLEQLNGDIESDITSMAQSYSEEERRTHVDCELIILALESQSNLMNLESEGYAATVKGCLRSCLGGWVRQDSSLDIAILKLAINITNSERGASTFDDGALLSSLIHSIAEGLSRVQSSLQEEFFQDKLYDELVLVLGIVINVVEHCPSARTSVDRNSLHAATLLWLGNLQFASDVDSVSKSKIGVAVGYLAIVLGYLYLTPSGRLQIQSCRGWTGTTFLVNSIQEFLKISKAIGSVTNELETLINDLGAQEEVSNNLI